MRIVFVDLPDARTMSKVVASDRSAAEYAALLDSATPCDRFVDLVADTLSVYQTHGVCLTLPKIEETK